MKQGPSRITEGACLSGELSWGLLAEMVGIEAEVTRESPEVAWSACQCLAKPMQEQTTFRPGNLPKWSYYVLVTVAKGASGGMITCDVQLWGLS